MASFNNRDWIENFRMQKSTFMYICNLLRPHIQKKDTIMRCAITVEKRVAVTLWRLATNVEYLLLVTYLAFLEPQFVVLFVKFVRTLCV